LYKKNTADIWITQKLKNTAEAQLAMGIAVLDDFGQPNFFPQIFGRQKFDGEFGYHHWLMVYL